MHRHQHTNNPYRICSKTVLDTSVPGILFDKQGVCQYVQVYEEMEKLYPLNEDGNAHLHKLINRIKTAGKNKAYDCVMGVSGGTDSTYALYQAIKHGLRPLAVHFDNGWNSAVATENIKKTCAQLNVDLYTYVVNWEEFKDLQRAFLAASVCDADIPTDVAIHATLIKTASKHSIKYVLNGHSFRTEFIMPLTWTYMDGRYIQSVHRRHGSINIPTYPNFTLGDMFWYNFYKGIQVIPFLNYFHYVKAEARKELEAELQWQYYGGHHHESIYTRFFQSYLLPVKFGIDKRRTELSAMILSGHCSREEALHELEKPYPHNPEDITYVKSKLGFSDEEFNTMMQARIQTFRQYPTYYPLIQRMKPLVKAASEKGLLPRVLYYKFYA